MLAGRKKAARDEPAKISCDLPRPSRLPHRPENTEWTSVLPPFVPPLDDPADLRCSIGWAAGVLRTSGEPWEVSVADGVIDPADVPSRDRRRTPGGDPAAAGAVAATVVQRMALHELGRLREHQVEPWSRRAIAVARPGDRAREEAEALLGLGIAWHGRIDEGCGWRRTSTKLGVGSRVELAARYREAVAAE